MKYKTMATDLLNAGIGDEGRLKFILSCIEKNKPLYKTDIRFLESMTDHLEWRLERLKGNTDTKQKEKDSRTLISNKELDEIIDRKDAERIEKYVPVRKKRSFLAR
ncbi:MAG: hypothetical protein IIC67_09650, partial [Thaumarchaeota archaeon]|nr:hypothetical protein [Nitrososphaerota archaeon]